MFIYYLAEQKELSVNLKMTVKSERFPFISFKKRVGENGMNIGNIIQIIKPNDNEKA